MKSASCSRERLDDLYMDINTMIYDTNNTVSISLKILLALNGPAGPAEVWIHKNTV